MPNALKFFFMLMCITLKGWAQFTPWVKCNLGLTFPYGSFASTDFKNRNSGYAMNGTGIAFIAGIKGNSSVSAEVQVINMTNSLNLDQMATDLSAIAGRTFYNPGEPADYNARYFLAGFSIERPIISKEIIFCLGSKIGMCYSERPAFNLFSDDIPNNQRYIFGEETYTSTTPAFAMSVGLDLSPDPFIQFGIHSDFISSVHQFSYTVYDANKNAIQLSAANRALMVFLSLSVRMNLHMVK